MAVNRGWKHRAVTILLLLSASMLAAAYVPGTQGLTTISSSVSTNVQETTRTLTTLSYETTYVTTVPSTTSTWSGDVSRRAPQPVGACYFAWLVIHPLPGTHGSNSTSVDMAFSSTDPVDVIGVGFGDAERWVRGNSIPSCGSNSAWNSYRVYGVEATSFEVQDLFDGAPIALLFVNHNPYVTPRVRLQFILGYYYSPPLEHVVTSTVREGLAVNRTQVTTVLYTLDIGSGTAESPTTQSTPGQSLGPLLLATIILATLVILSIRRLQGPRQPTRTVQDPSRDLQVRRSRPNAAERGDAMSVCRNCGRELWYGDRFCDRCGKRVA
jgi:hypothetical protein